MKVAIVYPFFAHYRGPIIESLLEDESIQYYFLAGNKTNSAYSSLKLYEFGTNKRFIALNNRWFATHFLYQSNLIESLRDGNFDQVIFLGDWKYLSTWIAVLYLNVKRIPALFWAHGLLNKKKSINNYVKLIFYKTFKFGGFVYDNRAKKIFKELKYKGHVDVIYNSLDYNLQSKIFQSLRNGDTKSELDINTPYLVFSGRLIKERNLELLLDAVKILKDKNVKVNVVIIGSGPELNVLSNYAEEIGVNSQVLFKGPCYDEKVLGRYFVNSIGCVFPGPIGLTAIHALTYGTLVLTNDNIDAHKPEIEAVRQGLTGVLFKDGDSTSLANKIDYLINLTDQERQLFRENALKLVLENFTPMNQRDIICNRLHDIQKNRL